MILVGEGDSPSTLRIYQWDPPTISLGYFQHFADYLALPPPAGELPVVRRLTGGGAILHDLELTYSITLPTSHPLLARRPSRLYELAHDAVIAALAELGLRTGRGGTSDDSGAAKGPFFCFQRRHSYDVLLRDGKIAGSAQRRTKSAVLQHGSIVLGNRYPQQPTAAAAQPFDEAIQTVRRRITEAFARVTDIPLEPGAWTKRELNLAAALGDKYAGDAWTRRT